METPWGSRLAARFVPGRGVFVLAILGLLAFGWGVIRNCSFRVHVLISAHATLHEIRHVK
jgi:hypothetical protein